MDATCNNSPAHCMTVFLWCFRPSAGILGRRFKKCRNAGTWSETHRSGYVFASKKVRIMSEGEEYTPLPAKKAPMISSRGTPPPRSTLPAVLSLALVALVSIALFMMSGDTTSSVRPAPNAPTAREEPETASLNELPHQNPGYLGPETCAECHRDRVAEFRRTNHFRTCRIPASDEMPSGFHDGSGKYVARFGGTRFEMTQRGDQFFQTTIQETASGEDKIDSRIDLVLGAGKADDVYVSWRDDGRMFELPIAWLWPSREWAASHFLTSCGTGDYSRAMTVRCMECHNTWMDYSAGSVNRYQHGTEVRGVTCERCHGPGTEHVAWHRENPGALSASKIIRPTELSRERLIETCTQCHSNAIVHRQGPFTYRPGLPLEEFFRTLNIEHPEDDHVANQIDHLRQSRCFQNSDTLTCITCHDPHRVKAAGENPSGSCSQCHQPSDCREQPRLPEPVRENCIGCHMPRRIKMNVKFETKDDNFVPAASRFQHRIAVDKIARDDVLLKWHRSQSDAGSMQTAEFLTDQLAEHWITLAAKHSREFRFLAAIADYREALAVRDTSEIRQQLQQVIILQQQLYDDWAIALNAITQNHPAAAIDKLEAMLRVKPNDAEVHSKLGTLYAINGKMDLAVPHLEAVAKFDRNNPSGHGVLGRIAWLNGQYEDALAHWKQAEVLDPFNAQILYDIGLALSRLNRRDEALSALERSAKIDPGRADIISELKALRKAESRSPSE